MDDPYFGITAKADFTSCYMQAKEDGESFFLYSLHKILRAVNAVEEFRYRIEDGRIVLYDLIGASPTIGRETGVSGSASLNTMRTGIRSLKRPNGKSTVSKMLPDCVSVTENPEMT